MYIAAPPVRISTILHATKIMSTIMGHMFPPGSLNAPFGSLFLFLAIISEIIHKQIVKTLKITPNETISDIKFGNRDIAHEIIVIAATDHTAIPCLFFLAKIFGRILSDAAA